MKKTTAKIFIGICVSSFVFMTSCNTFESEPLEWNTEDVVLNPKDSTAKYMQQLFFAIYSDLPLLHNKMGGTYLESGTDNGLITRDIGGPNSPENYRNGRISPSTINALDGDAWSRAYTSIRKANLFLQKIASYPTSTNLPEEHVVKMKAEARAMKAFHYFELLKRWGSFPIVYDEVFDLDSDLQIPRSSREECIQYILNEISPDIPTSCYHDLYDAQATVIPTTKGIYGRLNKGAMLGIISRLKLYVASPLYNESGDKSKWQEAADAAQALIDLNIYALHEDKDGLNSFIRLFAHKASFPNKEIIMMKQMTDNNAIERLNSPIGYYSGTNQCEGQTSPSQNLVDAFLTIDGKMIDESDSNYDPQNPYINRDPRLEFTIFHNESMWLKRPVETFTGGKDRAARPGMTYTQTGYYLRKFLSESEDLASFPNVPHHHQIIRYAEILLNYAEALCEVDYAANKAKIENVLIQLRKRAGINAGADGRYGLPTNYSYAEIQKIIRNERRIELAFEEHRFWDIRRWKIADEVMNTPVRGVVITKQADESYHYEYVDVRSSTFAPKMYWYPIPRVEMEGNSKLVQNPGWDY